MIAAMTRIIRNTHLIILARAATETVDSQSFEMSVRGGTRGLRTPAYGLNKGTPGFRRTFKLRRNLRLDFVADAALTDYHEILASDGMARGHFL